MKKTKKKAEKERLLKEFKTHIVLRTILNDFIQEEIVGYSFTLLDRRFDDSYFSFPISTGRKIGEKLYYL